jgi:hypothetical protein
MNRWDVINRLIEKYGYKDYLEIGYYKGWSFDNVKAATKTAVDPNPSKDEDQQNNPPGRWRLRADESEILYKRTSDQFFSELKDIEKSPDDEFHDRTKWDIVFVDGLHEAIQVFRDGYNAHHHLNAGGVVVFHDCNPPKYEHVTTGIDGCWTGDTYAAFTLLKYLKWGDFYTVDTDWGVGVWFPDGVHDLSGTPGIDGKPEQAWKYFDANRKTQLNLISIDEFNEREKLISYGTAIKSNS